jgi:hypothetical protein
MAPSTAPRNPSPATAAHPASSGSMAAAAPTQSASVVAKRAVASARRGSGVDSGCGDTERRSVSILVAAQARNGWNPSRRSVGTPRSGWRRPRGDTVRWSANILVAAQARNKWNPRRRPVGTPRSGWRRPCGDTVRWSAEDGVHQRGGVVHGCDDNEVHVVRGRGGAGELLHVGQTLAGARAQRGGRASEEVGWAERLGRRD